MNSKFENTFFRQLLLTAILISCCLIPACVSSQVNNAGNFYIATGENIYVNSDFINTSFANYQNNGNFYLTGDFNNNQNPVVAGSGSTFFSGVVPQNIMGAQSSNFNNVIINNINGLSLLNSIGLTGDWTNNGAFTPNNFPVTFNGSVSQSIGGANTTLFYNLTNSNTAGDVSMLKDVTVNNVFTATNNTNLVINSNTLTLSGKITGIGTLAGTSSSNLVINGSSSALGTLTFKAGYQLLNSLTLNRTGITNNYAVNLGSDLTVTNLTLSNGILTTGSHLFSWNSSGTLTSPNMPWAANNSTHSDSYIATCNSDGSSFSLTLPFTGAIGFRVLNVSGSSDVYFPVGSDVQSANRMAINMNNSATRDFTVVVDKGDIGNTVNPRINRIWYVHASDTTGVKTTMKLYFTKRSDFQNWPLTENEIEPPFPFNNIRLIQKDYSGNPYFINVSSGADVKSFAVADGVELYAQYTKTVSMAFDNSVNGITQFNQFSIINGSDIVLPVTITNLKAWADGSSAKIAWTSNNELNIDHYEIERATDAQHFIFLGSERAKNNGVAADYLFSDIQPVNGTNYYRIKIIDRNGEINFTSVVILNTGKDVSMIFIYPNPVKNILNIKGLDAGMSYELSVMSVKGRVAARTSINNSSFYSWNLQSLSKGVYYLRVISGDKKTTVKFVKE